MLASLAFYLFSGVLVLSALCVISARNPVHSVLFLILCFFNASALFILLGAEFVAMILAIVYVGAVAVLFLFVVMMLDVGVQDLRQGAMKIVPLGLLIGGVLLAELAFLFIAWEPSTLASVNIAAAVPTGETNTHALGYILYTQEILPFQASGIVLLIAMIGAIILCHRTRPGVRRQSVAHQVATNPRDVVEVKNVTTGTGVS